MSPTRLSSVFFRLGITCIAICLLTYLAFDLVRETSPRRTRTQLNLSTAEVPGVRTIEVLVWHTFGRRFLKLHFGDDVMKNCPLPCRFRQDKARLRDSDVVVFQSNIWSSLPQYRRPDQAWLLYAMEPPHRIAKPRHQMDALKINWTLSYRLDADIVHRHSFKLVRRNPSVHGRYAGQPLGLRPKPKPVAWIASNCHSFNGRELYVKQLNNSIPVDIYGQCGSHRCRDSKFGCYREIAGNYSFYLGFENSICKDYSTEKLFLPLLSGMVPVVMGGMDYTRVAPPGSYIDFADFRSPKELGEYLWYIHRSPREYKRFHDWKRDYVIERPRFGCVVCDGLHRLFKEPPRHYRHLYSFLKDDAHCTDWKGRLAQK